MNATACRMGFTALFLAAFLLFSGEAAAWHGRGYGHYSGHYYGHHYYGGPRVVVGPGWNGGYWYHGWRGGRAGWWWVVGPGWYYYDYPVYPYPVYESTTVVQPTGPAPAQSWYWCANPAGYYPYVSQCSEPWVPVPATPPPATTAAQP